jgi:CubicO group peptidase (beta-lactamase class C family)
MLAAVAIVCSGCMGGQTCSKASNVSCKGHGMDKQVLSQIPHKIQALIDSGQTTGMVSLVARNGVIASIDAVGWQCIDKDPLETTDVFWVASITKPFVAVSIMMLVEEGKLNLDDLVEEHIGEFKGQKVKAGKKMSETAKHPLTIRNLLNHLDGLPKNPVRSRATKTIKQRVLRAAKDTLKWEPGSKWLYGGEGLYVAAYLVEKYSGMEYTEFLKTRILDPLGMKNTYFTIKDVPKSRAVFKHSKSKKGTWQAEEMGDFVWDTDGNYFAVDGGFFSTVEDLFPWYQMLLNGGEYGGVRYLSENSVYELTHKQTGDVKPAGHGAGNFYALAFLEAVEPQGNTAALTKGSFGKGGAGGSITWVDPSTKTIYIMLQNIWGGNKEIASLTFLNTAAAAIPDKL